MNTYTAPVKPAHKPRNVRPAHGSARLTLAINGQTYALRILTVQPGSGVSRLVRLRKDAATTYHVHKDGHGCGCTCPDFTFSRDGIDQRGCKHILALKATGLL